MASILTGIGSTLNINGSSVDINTLVSGLMSVERAPITLLTQQSQSVQSEISAYGTLSSSLASLQTTAQTISDATTANPVTASSTDTTVANVTAQGGASVGSHTLSVTSLAQSEKLYTDTFSTATESVGSGTLTIELGSYANGSFTGKTGSSPVNITIDPAKSSINDIRDAINNASAGVTASVVNDGSGFRLVVASNDSGAANSIRLSTTDSDGANTDAAGLSRLAYDPSAATGSGRNMTEALAAKDAVFTLDGLPMTRPSNSLTDVVSSVTINLTKAGTTNIGISRDTTTASANAGAMVTAYNNVFSTLKNLATYDTTTQTGGPLFGESIVHSTQSQLRSLMNKQWGTPGSNYTTLSSVGISFGKDGTLALDSTKFGKAMAADPAAASAVLTTFGKAMSTTLTAKLSTDGPLTSRTTSLQSSVQRMADRQTQLEARMTAIEARYRTQFTGLQTMMNSMSSTSSFLTSQFNPPAKSTIG